MKLPLAENSLFAILLRSPWWISAAAGLSFMLAAAALLPSGYSVFGAAGALPFLGIAALCLARQWRRPGRSKIAATVDRVSAMSWREFADALEEAFRRNGYTVGPVNDTDADFLLSRHGRLTVVGCKRWKAPRTGVEPLRALQRARERLDAHDALYLAVGEIGEQAARFAVTNRLRIVGPESLTSLLHGPGLPADR